MLFSRWKVMTGLVGVSLGGLAALAGQLPKPEQALPPLPEAKVAAPEPTQSEKLPPLPDPQPLPPQVPKTAALPLPSAEFPTVPAPKAIPLSKPSAANKSTKPSTVVGCDINPKGVVAGLEPAGSFTPEIDVPEKNTARTKTPAIPLLPTPATPSLPSLPEQSPVELPALPLPSAIATPSVAPTAKQAPAKPVELPTLPLPAEKTDDAPKPVVVFTPGSKVTAPNYNPVPAPTPPTLLLPTAGAAVPPAPVVEPDLVPLARPTAPPTSNPPIGPPPLAANDPLIAPSKPSSAPAATKFRIVLRVGDGEPSFEVRHGDSLVMKVTCDKVDIKSPEKGQGSNVVATGKVKFVGFGAEGTCDSLSFLAGSGEVALSGNVNVKVRDKIGRVESELNAEKMQYKLDQTSLTGVLKP